ncbi:hypothetical protein F2Q69_00043556 [Brassica cretica]|uniref:Uncharacterized protein n=1 Tax=Brassica cretica TaxID=69181 RepID=A0A8S9NAK3_BRACR|nr:hypothetical protein F2Q69_00043556 [Brassica cretica]
MNKHLVETFLAFRNSQGRSRDAKDDQEDSPGDEVLAIDQGTRGRMTEKSRAHFIALLVVKSRGKVFDFLKKCGVCVSVGQRRSGGWSCLTSVVANCDFVFCISRYCSDQAFCGYELE